MKESKLENKSAGAEQPTNNSAYDEAELWNYNMPCKAPPIPKKAAALHNVHSQNSELSSMEQYSYECTWECLNFTILKFVLSWRSSPALSQ